MKITVIGATGTVGTRITVEALGRGHEVRGAVRDVAAAREKLGPELPLLDIALDNPDSLDAAFAGQDAVVSALNSRRSEDFPEAAEQLIEALRRTGSDTYLVFVGGAGSLRLPDGRFVNELKVMPEFIRPTTIGQALMLDYLRTVDDVAWCYVSPAIMLERGPKRGLPIGFGVDEVVIDSDGHSEISVDDYASALVDEVESRAHVRGRFTLAYA